MPTAPMFAFLANRIPHRVKNLPSLTETKTRSLGLDVEVDGQTPESWDKILAQFADANIYQTWAYAAVHWGVRDLSHLVLRRKEQAVAAAQVRIVRVPLCRVGVAYVRWAPMCQRAQRQPDPAVVTEMIASLRSEYVIRRGWALQIIPPAFSGGQRAEAFLSAFNRCGLRPDPSAAPYRTIVLDLASGPEIIRKQLDQKWRNQLNRSEKNGLTLGVSDSHEAYREFLRLYQGMWQRKQFESSVDVEEFGRIQDLLAGNAKMKIFLAKENSQPVAALVLSLLGNSAIYLLGATNERARDLKAAYFLQWQAVLWLKERGARWYDLGGIDPAANPGGHHFKSGLQGADVLQLPTYGLAGGLLGRMLLRGITWIRQRRRNRTKPFTAPGLPS